MGASVLVVIVIVRGRGVPRTVRGGLDNPKRSFRRVNSKETLTD